MNNPFEEIMDELKELRKMVDSIQSQFADLKRQEEERFMSIDEVCNLFEPKISRQTLYAWERQGILSPRYFFGRTVYYKRSEILNAVKGLPKIKR